MKQYDFVRAWANDASYDIDGPVIVMTVDEFKKIYDEIYMTGYKDKGTTAEEYLASVDLKKTTE